MLKISIIALIISGILALIRIYDFIKEKYNIKVKIQGNSIIADGRPIDENNRFVVVSVVNMGKEPITINGAALINPNGKTELLLPGSLEIKKLNTSDSRDYLIAEKNIPFDYKKSVACVIDSSGRYYYSHNFIKRYLRLKRIR